MFIVGLEDGLLPMKRVDTNYFEERRLFYVGLTRSRHGLYLYHCRVRSCVRACVRPCVRAGVRPGGRAAGRARHRRGAGDSGDG